MHTLQSFRNLTFLILVAIALSVGSATAQQNTIQGGRFVRGTGTNAGYHSFAIPLDFQRGLVCGDYGGVASILLPYLGSAPWLYHYDATNPASLDNLSERIAFQNPIGAFGSRVGGTPMYIGQRYRFGVYAGDVYYVTNALLIRTWIRTATNFTYGGAAYIDLPYAGYTNLWLQFQTNGYTLTVTTNGLTTIIGFENALDRWGTGMPGTFTLTHIADSTATNKVYQIELSGLTTGLTTDYYPLVATGAGETAYSPLYTLEFEYRPPMRAVFIDQPHFEGEPVPPAYVGKSLDELLTNSAIATSFSLQQAPSTYTNLDYSPELRRHPILDQFVSDMRRDPVALTRFVHNEIALTDAISYNDNGSISEVSINAGGVSRGALGTFLEGQGAPAEQCALLVYLLRQAGVPAVYVYPPHNGLKMLDTQLSRVLRIQLQGAVNDLTQLYTTNRQIGVNYPWVAAYIGTNWVHLFPWMKDTELIEGLNLYDYMPAAYNNGFKWLRDFALARTNILSFATQDDTPLGIYVKFLQNELKTSAPGLSLDDIGYIWRNRRNSYARWEDFPKPFATPTNGVAIESLSSSAMTNVYTGLTNIFDTITVEVSSVENSAKKVTTGEVRLADLHNRRLLMRHEKTGTNAHNLILSLAAFRTNATGPTNFTVGDALLNVQQVRTNLTSTDTNINIRVTYKRHRALPQNIVTNRPVHWVPFAGLTAQLVVTEDRQIKKGDLAGICLDYGLVSRAMLNVHAQDLWNMERLLKSNPSATNTLSPDLYQGGTAFLMGMAYYERYGRFRELNERLHKERVMSEFAYGLSSLSAKRVSGQLPNQGDIILVQPKVDMNFRETAIVGNHTLHPDSGADPQQSSLNFCAIELAELSAEEHHIIDGFFNQSNSISTVKLLQLAQQRAASGGSNVLILNNQNFASKGTVTYNGVQLKNHDAALWAKVTNFLTRDSVSNLNIAFVTPGSVTNSSNSYKGMGALLFSPYGEMSALIGQNLNGGVGPILPDSSFTAANTPNYILLVDPNGNFNLTLTSPTLSNPVLAPDTFASYSTVNVVNNATQNYYGYSGFQSAWTGDVIDVLGLTSQGSLNLNFSQSIQAAEGDRGYQGWLGDGLSQPRSGVSDPVHSVTGEFYVNATDLFLAGPMPMTVNRNYSSLNLADNQFGYGWKLNYMPFLSLNSDSTLIFAAEPDGAVLAYAQTGTNANVYLPSTAKNPQLNNNRTAGIGSTANRLRNRIEKQTSGPDTFYYLTNPDGSKRTFKVISFAGSVSRTRPYLTRWEDNSGNGFTFEYGTDPNQPDYAEVRRIQSSNGNYLGFYYDVYGHIIEAYAGDSRRLDYEYDQFGDLVRVTFPDASEIQYEYEHKTQVVNGKPTPYSTHLILRELKPDGRVLQNEYDQHRRVTNQWSTVGADLNLVRNATFIYSNNFNLTNSFTNTITGYTLIKDVFNKTNRYDYTNGLITKVTDPLNQTVEQYWYADNSTAPGSPRSLWKKKDQRGLWTEFKYDGFGNVSNTVTWGDLSGDGTTQYATNTVSYNAYNLPEEAIDPAGNKVKTVYDGQYPFLPAQVIKYAGSVAVSTNKLEYYGVTNVFTSGGVTFTNLSLGLLRRETRAFGSSDAATTEWLHDSQGFITNRTQLTGTSDPDIVVNFIYNGRGELVEQTDADGRKTRLDYDGMGRLKAREIFEAGQAIPLAWDYSYYNENGELTWSDGPRFAPEDYVWRDHDGVGRVTTEIHWRAEATTDGTGLRVPTGDKLSATTFNEFDAFGNLKRTINPRGAVTTNTYDAIGQLIGRKGLETNGTVLTTEGFAYEPGGLVSFYTNALNGFTEKQYTTTGQLKYQRNPDGSTNAWRYQRDGRLFQEILSNGNLWETVYDDANRKVTRYFKRGSTYLATKISEFDCRGNLIRRTDEAGNVSTNGYDGLNRIKVAAGPPVTNVTMQMDFSFITNVTRQTTTYTYDSSGKVLTVANSLGDTTITMTDALGRPVSVEVRNTNDVVVRLTTIVYAANHHSQTVTNGSGPGSVASAVFTDNDGRTVLSVIYPTGNAREYTLRDYDLAGNLTFDANYAVTNGITVFYSGKVLYYDGLNRLVQKSERDDAPTTFAYDAGGHVTNRIIPGGLKWQATYNSAGQMLKEWNLDGGTTGARTNTYTYYASGQTFAGLLQTRTDNRGVTCTYTYDDWLRPATNAYTGTPNEHNLSITFRYEARGLLTTITENFASGATGPSNNIQRTFDANGTLDTENVALGGVPFASARQTWDVAGRRSQLILGTGTYGFGWRADGLLSSVSGPPGGSSYSYTIGGLLTNRTVGPRATTVTSWDGAGRPLAITTAVNGQAKLSETLTWTGDNLLATHAQARTNEFTDSRAYFYASFTRRLIEERLNLDATNRWTNVFTFDSGQAAGPGVLTKAGSPNSTLANWSGGADSFSRIANETNNVTRRPAYGRINGPATVTALLDGVPVGVNIAGTNDGQWRTTVELTPGTHRLDATAVHPSHQFTNNAVSWFTNTASADRATDTYDGNGFLTQRVWKKASGQTNRTQTLVWDAKGRLYKITDRDSSNNGRDFYANYDALDRLLRTREILVTNNLALTNQPIVTDHYFDPAREFLEIAVSENGVLSWKLLGPDTDGVYGSQNGTGGLEATVSGTDAPVTLIADVQGKLLGQVSGGTVTWYASRLAAYGAVPGYRPSPLGQAGAAVGEKYAWRNRAIASVGYVWLGGNWYDPDGGRFLSFDVVTHAQSSSPGYVFCGGDPINVWDPDGRYGVSSRYEPPVLRAADPSTWQTYDTTIRGRDVAGSFADQMYNNIVLGLFTQNSLEAMNARTAGANTPDVQFYNGISRTAQENFGSPMAQTGVYNSDSRGAALGQAGGDALTLYLALEGARGQMTGRPSPSATWQDFLPEAQQRLQAVQAQYGYVDAFAMAQEEGQMLYRGVARGSVHDVQQQAGGAIVPRGGTSSMEAHVNEGQTTSPFTSWTTDINVARRFAGSEGPIFQVDRNQIPNQMIETRSFSRKPGEKEVLIRGTIYGVRRIRQN